MGRLKLAFVQVTGADTVVTYDAQDWRYGLLGALITAEGCLGPSTSLKVSQRGAGANMSVDVAIGWCAIQGDDTALQGLYVGGLDAVENVVVPAAPGSGTRTHRIVFRVKDETHESSYTDLYIGLPELLEDTGSGTPALPSSAINLATVAVAAGTVSITDGLITDTRVFTACAGGIVPSSGASGGQTLEGSYRDRADTNTLERYSGAAWSEYMPPSMPRGRVASGATNTTSSPALSNGEAADPYASVTFTADATRSYSVRLDAYFQATDAGKDFTLKARWAAGSSVTSGGTILTTAKTVEASTADEIQYGGAQLELAAGVISTTGTVTVGLFFSTVTGGGGTVVAEQATIVVSDVGD